jgi:hypothetical protein
MSDENFEGDEGFKNLRAAYDKLKAEKAEAEKTAQALLAEKRTASLSEILKAKGLKETVASHYTGDVSEEAVTKWATDLGLITEAPATLDANAEAAARAAAAAGGSEVSGASTAVKPGDRILGDPAEIMSRLNNLSYDDLVKIGYMPADPNQI